MFRRKNIVMAGVFVMLAIGCDISYSFSSPQNNLVKNGDMEEKTIGAGWGKTSKECLFIADTERAWGDGKQSLKLTNGERGVDIHQTFAAEAGKTYLVKFWAKVEEGNYIEFVAISDSKWKGIGGMGRCAPLEWTEYEFTFKATDTKMNILIRSVVPGKSIWLDDVSLVEVKEEAVY